MFTASQEEQQIGGWKVHPKNNVKQPVANKAPVAAPVVAVAAPAPAPAPAPAKHKSKSAKKSKSNSSKSSKSKSNSHRNNVHSFASILAGGSGASVEQVKRLLEQLT
jgi:hypothetical protein